MKVAIINMGCRLNSAEAATIAESFVQRGDEIIDSPEGADLVFINSCTVTDSADSSCRNLIRKAKKSSPLAKIVVAGCYAQVEGDKLKEALGVDLILGNAEKMHLFDFLEANEGSVIGQNLEFYKAKTTRDGTTTRAFLKIQDGCNYFCSYCIIPFARGRARGISIADAMNEGHELLKNGFKEIVLTGINIGEYQKTSGEKFENLVAELLTLEEFGLKRLRISSIEPNTVSEELLSHFKTSKIFMPHLHIPLQSGDETVLKWMKRKYSREFFRELCLNIHRDYPSVAIGTDLIVGFPGETEELFQNTLALLEELPLTHFHLFPFSKREGTLAAKMDKQISKIVKKERMKQASEIAIKKSEEFAKKFEGEVVSVLFEQVKEIDGKQIAVGHSEEFLEVSVSASTHETLKNSIREVFIERATQGKLSGRLQSET